MRILHPSQVGYIQQQTNNSNTTSTHSITSIKANDIIGHLSSSTEDYPTDLSNINGNSTEVKYSYGLIDADDNVNLTISPSHNLSVRYIKNQNHKIALNTAESHSEILCNNLNQLNNLRCANRRDSTLNGNDNDNRQIFEGNLNVLEVEEANSPKRSVPSSAPAFQKDKTKEERNSSPKSSAHTSDEEEELEGVEEELEGSDGRNLICNEYHLNKAANNANNVSNSPSQNGYGNSVKVRNSGHINSSSVTLRRNLAKLDLDTNLQNSYQSHRHPQQFGGRQNQSSNTYKRGRTYIAHTERQCTTGRISNYPSTYSCESSPDDSLMEDEDAYSPSPSSSASLNSPEPSNFPRGIINPNYPGFQHLAHTLSEHFVNHQSDADDSDLSEFEVELSVESIDENLEHFQSNSYNNNNSINNNNNNNDISTKSSDTSQQNMSPNDELNYNLETTAPKESREHKVLSLPEIRVSSSLDNHEQNKPESNRNQSKEELDHETSEGDLEVDSEVKLNLDDCEKCLKDLHAIEDISCDLGSYVQNFMAVTDLKVQEKELLAQNVNQDEPRNCPTPDILIKNEKSICRQKSSENQPDLLQNVSLRTECANCDDHQENGKSEEDEKKKTRISVPDNISIETRKSEREDSSYGVTPVDIVGDFGREIEREFGLIVSGYNTRLLCRDYSPATSQDRDHKLILKTADAVLSDAKEQLSINSGVNSVGVPLGKPECTACDLVQVSTAGEVKKTQEEQQSNPEVASVQDEQDSRGNDNASSSKVIAKNSASIASSQNQNSSITSCAEKHIPTAIVKPKYQKSSYDDRQLPPVGLGYYDYNRAWYESKCSSDHQYANAIHTSTPGTSGNDQRSRKAQCAAQFDRNSKISKKVTRGGSSTLNSKLSSSRQYEKDNEGSVSVVAVVTPRKKEKMEVNISNKRCNNLIEKNNNDGGNCCSDNNNLNCVDNKQREAVNEERKDQPISASFDVYNIETALPVIDLEAIENHLKKAKEEERKRRNDREEIRRKLAMGAEDDYFSKIVSADRPSRKPSLQSRLQSGMNLQICFMNEASSDTESPSSDSETCPKLSKAITHTSRYSSYSTTAHPYNSRPLSVNISNNNNKKSSSRPSSLSLGPPVCEDSSESDFFTKQARLQIEARMALAQAKDMAHMQMEIERQKQKQSPITEVIRNSLEKVGVPFPPEKRRVSRQMLTDMNIAQLQIIVNELHTQIERLNEQLVQFLMERDELHMSQDSMLVDIEDLTRYLGAKEQSKANERANNANPASTNPTQKGSQTQQQTNVINSTNSTSNNTQTQSKFQRIASLVKK